MGSPWWSLFLLAALDLALQWGLWVAAAALRTEKFFDAAGSGTFVLLAHLSLQWGHAQHPRQQVQTALVTIWALRLGLFLFLRILKEGHDRRFNGIRENPGTFFLYWTMQGMWVFITLLPTLLLNLEKHGKPLGFWDYLGWSIWAVGFTTEAVADQQKWHFRSNPDNVDKFIQSGLWAYSRHPNYLGEILLWTGLFVSATSVLRGWQYISVLSPLLVWFLLSHVILQYALQNGQQLEAIQNFLGRTSPDESTHCILQIWHIQHLTIKNPIKNLPWQKV